MAINSHYIKSKYINFPPYFLYFTSKLNLLSLRDCQSVRQAQNRPENQLTTK